MDIASIDQEKTWGMFGSCTLMARIGVFNAVGSFDESFRRSAELDFAIRAAFKGAHFIAVNKSLINMHKTKSSDKKIPVWQSSLRAHRMADEPGAALFDGAFAKLPFLRATQARPVCADRSFAINSRQLRVHFAACVVHTATILGRDLVVRFALIPIPPVPFLKRSPLDFCITAFNP